MKKLPAAKRTKKRRVAKRYTEADMQRAYNRGVRDGRNAASMGSYRDWA
jgi:hypothetical protein